MKIVFTTISNHLPHRYSPFFRHLDNGGSVFFRALYAKINARDGRHLRIRQIDAELVANKKRSLISDDLSLAKIISYCTSRGTVTVKTVAKTRNVNRKEIEGFIDIDEAYQRIKKFITTSQFFSLPKDDQMNVMAFILIMERKPTEGTMDSSIMDSSILEDTIIRALNQIPDNRTVV